MKKLLALLLALTMLFSLAACGGETAEDPNAGKYIGVSAAVGGFALAMSEVYPGETWIELKSGGKGDIMLGGDNFPMKWTLEGDVFTLTIDGADSIGTLSNGTIVIDLMDMGCVMTFQKEGTEPAENEAPAASYNDAGYWDLIRIDGATEEDSVSEEDLTMLREMGMYMYLELLEDGTGVFFMDEEMAVTWVDGTVNFTEDNMSLSYTLENGELILDMIESVMVFRKGEKPAAPVETEPEETEPAPVVSEMEQAGFTEFMELGVPYAFTNLCYENEAYETTGEATVVSYEIFESAEGYEPLEGYEWRVVTIAIRFFDDNAWNYGAYNPTTNFEDYYNVKLLDDTCVLVEEMETYDQYRYTIIHNGQEMDVYYFHNSGTWSDWSTDDAGNHEMTFTFVREFLVPVGYDGCVVGIRDRRVELPENSYITDMNPNDFLLFRLN